MIAPSISLLEVQARWGYSEITGSVASVNYGGPAIEALRTKRTAKVPFDTLSDAERYDLAFSCACARPGLLVYLTGVVSYRIRTLDRDKLGKVLVAPNVWYPESSGRFVSFADYMKTKSGEPLDARNVQKPTDKYRLPGDPLTFGRSFGHAILIDGYHRAASFWLYGPPGALLEAYVPDPLIL